ncbi:hypothetical protein [Rhodococcus sp. (in: high G+C Gram-positive bacteria)]|uniref:hypothetical protein n=1 Tax=Rhodococcus sp. TaxID=1831 RepID=UPI00257BF312|nr:hypothetical protein [Rhodococcus sp. (in: high G+C Gram-positive bacteria)]MBQ7805077.1 hypothetical protein [Rhodococcus sp. (in: high G+C Gram-positive bacteria)]
MTANFFALLAKENRVGMRGQECHPWAEKISLRACEYGLRKFLGAIGRHRRQGLRAGHRRRESEGQKDKQINALHQDGAQRSSIRRTPVGGRPPGRRQQTAGEGLGGRTSHSLGRVVIVRELRLVSGLSVAVARRWACVLHPVSSVLGQRFFGRCLGVSKVVFSPLSRVLIRVRNWRLRARPYNRFFERLLERSFDRLNWPDWCAVTTSFYSDVGVVFMLGLLPQSFRLN